MSYVLLVGVGSLSLKGRSTYVVYTAAAAAAAAAALPGVPLAYVALTDFNAPTLESAHRAAGIKVGEHLKVVVAAAPEPRWEQKAHQTKSCTLGPAA
eukprot:scaffold111983_cov20-Tisochrysis_lutea.AAC.1